MADSITETLAASRKRSKPGSDASCEALASINFNDRPTHTTNIILLPKNEDEVELLLEKTSALAGVVSHNRSLAVWTSFAATPNPKRDPIAIAKKEADVRELEMFNRFEDIGCQLPPSKRLDVLKDVKPLDKENRKTAARYVDMASCVDEVFGTQGASKENVAWIVENMEVVLPLVKFYLRVKRARRNLAGGQDCLTSNELAEYQTVRKIRSVLGVRMQKFRMEKASERRLRGYDVVLLRRQNEMAAILKGQRDARGRVEGFSDGQESRAKRQRCSA
ncbi:hypothetical protein CORC01_00301 [Colletotrichum orchidophilum]|uniref:Uncharacterized protein n=1 Tax=Colletotrichum orchidophilum TaxID=1209926 RepID=A0A1G4BSR2_9PEZI|nr:uncharacterized protein CORC01_00301 [Colletotrichum orchidophilum]OHF04449.1 hypothetical protein CORC01_00301 [Colletotrichum orchidophilum]